MQVHNGLYDGKPQAVPFAVRRPLGEGFEYSLDFFLRHAGALIANRHLTIAGDANLERVARRAERDGVVEQIGHGDLQ